MKITAEMTCAECKKQIKAKGKPWQGRRSSGVDFPDLFVVENLYENTLSIVKGYRHCGGDDAEDVVCSEECVLDRVKRLLKKMPATDAEN